MEVKVIHKNDELFEKLLNRFIDECPRGMIKIIIRAALVEFHYIDDGNVAMIWKDVVSVDIIEAMNQSKGGAA